MLIEQNIKRRTGPALCVFSLLGAALIPAARSAVSHRCSFFRIDTSNAEVGTRGRGTALTDTFMNFA
jgi:hypothetical protein